MKKALVYGLLASMFFALTFILNRSMNLGGGYWLWSASLRYLFMLPMLWLLLRRQKADRAILREIRARPVTWLVWSTVGFGLFSAQTGGNLYLWGALKSEVPINQYSVPMFRADGFMLKLK